MINLGIDELIDNDYVFFNALKKYSFSYDQDDLEELLHYLSVLNINSINTNEEFYVPSEFFKAKINDKSVIDYIIDNRIYLNGNALPLDYDIVLEFIEKGYTDFLSFAPEELLLLEKNGETILEYLFKKKLIKANYIPNIKDTLLIDLCKKYKIIDILNNASEVILYSKYDEYSYLIDYLFDNDLVNHYTVSGITNHPDIITSCIYYGKTDLLTFVDESLFKMSFDSNTTYTYLDYIIDNGVKFKKRIKDIDIIKKLVENNRLDILAQTPIELLPTMIGDRTLFSLLLEAKGDINSFKDFGYRLSEEDSLKLLKDIDRLQATSTKVELLSCLNVRVLLNKYGLNTYLDYILIESKAPFGPDINHLHDKVQKECKKDVYFKADVYYIYAKRGLISSLPKLTKKELLEVKDGTRLIDELSKKENKLLNQIIPDYVLEDPDVAIILGLKGHDSRSLRFDNLVMNLRESLNPYKEYSQIEVNPEYQELIDLFISTMDDGKSDMHIVNCLTYIYRYLYKINCPTKNEIIGLIAIKSENPDFAIKINPSNSYFETNENAVYVENEDYGVLCHEVAHALLHNLSDLPVEDEFLNIINKLKNSDSFLDKVIEYNKEEDKIRIEIEDFVDNNIMPMYKKESNDRIKEINEFLIGDKEKQKEKYLKEGYDPELLDKVLDEFYDLDKCIKHDYHIKERETYLDITDIHYYPFTSVGDFIDGIMGGEYFDGNIKDRNGEYIKGHFGHGVSYYANGPRNILDEMVANYAAIIDSKEPDKNLDRLRYYVGDELVNYIATYYAKHILEPITIERMTRYER